MTRTDLHRRPIGQAVALLLGAITLTSCSGAGAREREPDPPVRTSIPSTTATTATTASTTAPAPPRFVWQARPIDDALRARMTASWRRGCPVPLESLRYVTLTFWGFDGATHEGELVVNADAVDSLRQAFSTLFDQRFPIRSMRLVDDFGADDDRSMAADNTSSFNCRPVAGSSRWSQHAFGRAIDINPVENPYLHDGIVDPPNAGAFVDRADARPGMLIAGSPAVAAFTDAGWSWGGTWVSPDYQHMSRSGS